MKKINLTFIVISLITILSCKKESDFKPSNILRNNSIELVTENNSTYGNWLKFSDRDDFVTYANSVNEIYENEINPDSVLNILDNTYEIISMRQFYTDTFDFDFPETYDSVEFVHGTLSAITNKYSIYQIGDTIIRIGKNYVFAITDGDANSLSYTDDIFDAVDINEELLPSNISIYKVIRDGSMDEIEASGKGYNISFTYQNDYWVGSKTRYKLVAGYVCYSYEYPVSYTEYYTYSRFEMGKRNIAGVWKWNIDWATPLVLNTNNYFTVKHGNISSNYTKGTNQSSHGKRVTLKDYYWWDPYTFDVYYFTPIDMHSYHKSVRSEGTLENNIYKP